MKIALAYDYLNQLGGGERVLLELTQLFPDAPVYTIFYDAERTHFQFADREIKTSFLNNLFVCRHHRMFIPIFPVAAASLNLKNKFDLIISIGAGYSHGIKYQKSTRHLHYCFTPLRYAWNPNLIPGRLRPLRFFTEPIRRYLKNWDFNQAQRPDRVLAISNFIKNQIALNYCRGADVIYPPYDDRQFYYDPQLPQGDYFLAVGRLLHYKKFDLIISAFNQLNLPLKIIGAGPDRRRLEKIVRSSKIEFLDYVKNDADLRGLYGGARAFIFPQVEDFGLVSVEAQACGLPVIAYAAGGALETVTEGFSGVFFNRQTPESLATVISRFSDKSFDRSAIAQAAQRFSSASFKKNFLNELTKLV